jgi:outer membrane protein
LKKNLATVVCITACAAFAQAQTAAQAPATNGRPSAPAATLPPSGNVTLPAKIAVIDIQVAIMNTKEGSAAGNALSAKYQPKRDEFDKRQRDIQSIQDQLKKGSATMSDDAKGKLERDMDSKTKALQRDTQEASDDYEQEMGKVFNEIGGKMMQIIEQYSYQNGYAVVLDASNRQQSSVLWAAPSSNITADIIKLYDQAHPAASSPAGGAAKPATPAAPKQLPPPSQVKK